MTVRKQQLNSELPIDKLLVLSEKVAEARFKKYYFNLKNDSLLLNPTRRGAGTSHFIDITGLRGMLENYTDTRVRRSAEGDVPIGMYRNREWQLRQVWIRHEYHLKRNGATDLTSLPIGNVADDIACLAVNLKIVMEELVKMRRVIADYDAKQEEKVRSTRTRNGGYIH
jgi:hypothetical protein